MGESLWLSPAQVRRFDRFHFMNIRSILGLPAAFISRIPHAEIHRISHAKVFPAGPLAQVYTARRMKFLGHILRRAESLEYDVLFDHAGSIRHLSTHVTPIREGIPRPHW